MAWCFPIWYFSECCPEWIQVYFRVLVILFLHYLFIWPFCFVLSVLIFYSKIVLLPLHPVFSMPSWIVRQLGRIFLRCLGMSCFVFIVSPFVGIFKFLFFQPITDLFPQVLLFGLFAVLVFSFYPSIFPFFFIIIIIIIIITVYTLEFSHQCKLVVFHWKLSDSKSPQVHRTLLSILADYYYYYYLLL